VIFSVGGKAWEIIFLVRLCLKEICLLGSAAAKPNEEVLCESRKDMLKAHVLL